ncbi:MAG TPA: nitronate monooxygenase family protein [Rhizomicrobium sp.]|jgi:enoyl-[acyl-carrier protein] reductase II|nr:nitronate monooxygenase family protein [Rhizomicrobium sp.]
MALRTPLCDMLGIQYPIMLAGMGGVSYGELAAAVSEAGGFGTLGMAGRSPDEIRHEMKVVRDLTDKPFGVDLLAAVPESLERTADIIIEGGAKAFISGLGVPPPHLVKKFHDAGLKVMNVNGTVKHARSAEAGKLDAVVAQGTEAGGHTGRVAGMALIPQIVDAVKIPVIAAGSIVDGRGLAAALALGAQGVWMGTRFIAATEAHAGGLYKQVIVDANDEDTIITRSYSGKPMRVFKNEWVADWEKRPGDIKAFPAQAILSTQAGVMGGIGGQIEGLSRERSAFAMGQGAGGIHDVKPSREIVREIMEEAEAVIARMAALAKLAAR